MLFFVYYIIMETSKALAQNTVFQIIGKVLATIFGVMTVAILTRYLGTAGYGQLTVALTFLSIFAVIVDFGLTLTTVQMISAHHQNEEKILGNLISLRLLSAIIFLSLAPLSALLFPYEVVIKVAIAIGAVSFLFGTTAQMLIGVFQKRLQMGKAVIAELINRLLIMVGAMMAPTLGLTLSGIMWLFVIGNGAQLVIMLFFAGRLVKLKLRWQLSIIKEIIARSWPIGASIFFNLIYLRGDILFLSLWRPDAEVGIYGAAYKVVDVVTVVPVMYMGLILPMLVSIFADRQKEKFNKLLQQTFDFFSVLGFPIAAGSIVSGVAVMELIAGSEFRQSGEVLAIFGLAMLMIFFNSLFGHAVVGVGKQRPMVWAYFAVAAVTIAGYVAFIPTYGIWAAAWWTVIAETLIGIISFVVVSRISNFTPNLILTARAIFSSLIMALTLLLLPPIHALLEITVGAAIYIVALTALGGPKPAMLLKLFLPEKPPIAEP